MPNQFPNEHQFVQNIADNAPSSASKMCAQHFILKTPNWP